MMKDSCLLEAAAGFAQQLIARFGGCNTGFVEDSSLAGCNTVSLGKQ
jgi:hypothetical protein